MSRQRPTLLAVVSLPGEEASAPGGTLVISGWRGARTGLVTLQGSDDPRLRAATARAATLLGAESYFHWNAAEFQVGAARLARTLRAFQPTLLLTNEAARPVAAAAWQLAADPTARMPGLPLFDPSRARLWAAAPAGEARVDTSAARALLRAARFYHDPAYPDSSPSGEIAPLFERFALLAGAGLTEASVTDLFAGLAPSLLQPPISFLAEDNHE
jgi:hypothetical protein